MFNYWTAKQSVYINQNELINLLSMASVCKHNNSSASTVGSFSLF
jgi:hypothetical protein